MKRFLLQMAGESGSGKSTLALAVARQTGAIALNKDHIAGPLIEEGVMQTGASGPAYAVFFTLAESLLQQGFSVVLDSPAFWQPILDRGRELSKRTGVDYGIVRCRCDDRVEQEQRLRTRARLVSQPGSRAELAASLARPGVMLALEEPHLEVDTTQPLEVCVQLVLEYLRS